MTVEIIIFGIIVTTAVWLLLHFILGWGMSNELRVYKLAPRATWYAAVLIWEIIKADIAVMPYIFGRKKRPDGEIIQFSSGLKTTAANVILANSITLTPGTVTISCSGDVFTVHCLSPAFADGIDDSVFLRLLRGMEAQIDA